jgi:pyrroline-5-carboxylate reductase
MLGDMAMEPALESIRLAFIGGGNMARCLIAGARDAGVPGERIRVGEPDAERRAALAGEYGVECHADNATAVDAADVIVFAVKPQAAAGVARDVAGHIPDGSLVISIMAGIRRDALRRWLGDGPVIVRTMPNTPAMIGLGITALHAHPGLDDAARARADALLATAGETLWLDDESLMDAVTAVSGSGPAYCFLVLESLAAAGAAAGLDQGDARRLALQTMRGAAEMAARSGADPAELRRQVTSPGGTTEAAITVLESSGLRAAFESAVTAATARGRELADESWRDG